MKLFGFDISGIDKKRQQNIQNDPNQKTFTPPQNEDGAITVSGAGYYGTYVDLDGTYRNESQLITKYRELAIQPEMEAAIDEIVNEAIVFDRSGSSVSINLDELKVNESIKKKIEAEFEYVLKLLNFSNMGHEVFRRWYIDGRLFYHIVIDDIQPMAGIQELRYVDPRRIRKIREIKKMRDPATGVELIDKTLEYYLYNERGINFTGAANLGAKIAVDSIVNINSGLMDPKQTMVLSYLHKAIKPYNNLRMVEDAVVIYRLSRAPERRIFYIDVGNMPTVKAEQYVRDIMVKYRNKLVYDSSTGELKDDRKHLSMLEDFWLPRREGSKGTEISTLQGGQNLGQMDDVHYFQTKLYKALGVPVSRLEQNNGFSLGRTTEITRDELKFNKFVERLRNKFTGLFDDLLRVQCVLKKICTDEEWKEFKDDIWYDFKKDNNFDELKDNDVMGGRFQMVQLIDPYVGKYVSVQWVRKNILHQDDEEIELINAEMQAEAQVQQQIAQQQMADQQAMQQQDMQQQLGFQAAQQQIQQQAQNDANDPNQKPTPAEKDSRGHEQKMMDKKIELERIKSKAKAKTASSSKAPPKKKSVMKEAADLGLRYIGNGMYGNDDGEVTHFNDSGILTRLNK